MPDSARYLNVMAQRRRVYREVTKILADDVPYVILNLPREDKAPSSRGHGFVHVPDGMPRLRTVWLAA
jgi:ABC-type transport system substrate-binding protein